MRSGAASCRISPSSRCLSPAPGAADADRARLPSPDGAGDEDASIRAWRALLPRGPRCGGARAAGPCLGGTGLAADDGRNPAAPAVRRARQGAMRTAAALAVAVVLGACAGEVAPGGPSPTSSQLQAVVAASELVVGNQQRVTIGITDHNTPVSDATVHVRSFILNG